MTEKKLSMLRRPVFWVFILAFGIRLFASLTTAVVNPDGLVYIHQARAIFFQQWDQVTGCGMRYISILPPMIAAAFALFRDWVVAARFVSLAFGFGAMFPLYLLLKRFFEHRMVALALLIYAFIPALVVRSADIIRGPDFWFFLPLAFLMVVRHQDRRSTGPFDINLALACIFFLLAALARIEALLYLVVTAVYLLFTAREGRIKAVSSFFVPLAGIAIAGLLAALAMDLPLTTLLRLDKPVKDLTGFVTDYRTVRTSVDTLAKTQTGHVYEFLKQAGDFVWIVPLGPLLDCMVEKFFYPYVLIFLVGLAGVKRHLKTDPRAGYFLWMCVSAGVLLYLYTLKNWMIYDRFLANLILPAVLFVGYGCAAITGLLEKRWHFSARKATVVLAVVILAFGLGKNLKPRYAEKRIFVQMAEEIRERKSPGEIVRIAALPSNAYDWVFFYANRDVGSAVCDKAMQVAIPQTYDRMVARMKRKSANYLIYSEKTWAEKRFNPTAAAYEKDFTQIGKWDYDRKDTYYLMALNNTD